MISNFPYSHDYETPILIFHQLNGSNSKITCYRRSSLRSIPSFKEVYGLNAILSCTTCKNPEIKANECGVLYFNIPYKQSKLYKENKETIETLVNEIKRLYYILMNENLTLLIHSASGVRRTGYVVYSLLRMNGETKESALEIVLKLREEKRNGIGDFRIEFAEKILVPKLINKEKQKED